ncbi:DUF1176 domain-containing protein [Enterobacter sp. Bisph1]|uniref:DUF1176 domain-containing protein n=1 Tax=Enterobacter sp. Bisph1 TaxID=1274399 RepID=UPI00057C11CE|nr:DUF1176 domain-containing protein [Enterobacter sp. Bisph1]
MRYRSVLTLLFGLLAAPWLNAAPAQRSFSDWQVTCNNQNFCVARNTGAHHGLVMTLERSAGARTDARLRIDYGGIAAPVTKEPPIVGRLHLDGQPLTFASERWQITPWHLMTDNSEAITAFLQKVQEGQALALQGSQSAISLVGLKAALLFIDALQKRVGSETAWIKKGDSPPLSVPPAPALKKVARAHALPAPLTQQELNDLLDYGTLRMNSSQCSLDPLRRQVRVSALSDDKALLLIDCEAGAYNMVERAWLVSRDKPFSARLVRLQLPFTPGNGDDDMELMNSAFDEKTRELTTLSKGRSQADCGVSSRWRFDGQRFRLVRYAQEPTCDNWHGPDAWPTLWVTR